MDDLVGTVAEKAGIDEMKAKLAVLAVLEKIVGVLPGQIADQVKGALGVDAGGMAESAADAAGLGGIADAAKGFLGGGDDDDEDGGGGLGGIAKGLLG